MIDTIVPEQIKPTSDDLAELYGINNWVRYNLDGLTHRVALDMASLLIVDGGLGTGKTTLAVQIADYLNGSPIDLELQLAMGGSQFQKKLENCFKLGLKVLIYDEAGDFDRKGWASKFNKMLNRLFDIFRAFGIIVIIVLPNFSVLQQDIFDKQIPQMLFNCYDRHKNYSRVRVFSLQRMMWIKHFMKTAVIKGSCYSYQTPNCSMIFHDLPKERETELAKASTKSKAMALTNNIKVENGYLFRSEICEQLHKSESWFKHRIVELKIRPVYKIGMKACYSPDVLERLKQTIPEKDRTKQMSYKTLT